MYQPATIAVRLPFALLLALACSGSDLVLPTPNTSSAPANIRIVKGDDQSGVPGTMLRDSVVVRVTDSTGAPVVGQRIEFVPNAPEAAANPSSAVTDSAGIAAARWVLGATTGSQELVARVVGAGVPEGLEVRFSASVDPGPVPAPTLHILAQPSSAARIGEAFETQPVIQLRDADGHDLSAGGIAVTAAVVSGSGALAGTTTRLTNSSGTVAFTDLRIDGAAGSHTLIFAAAGYTSVMSLPIDVSPVAVQRSATTTRIVADEPDPSAIGQPVLVQFTVSSDAGTPSGDVVVTVSGGSESCTGSVASGSCSLTLVSAGNRELTASYAGNDRFTGSSDRASHRVESPGLDQPPIAVSDRYDTIEGDDHTLTVVAGSGVLQNDRDPEGSGLTASDASDPPNGTVRLNSDGSFSYTPTGEFYGKDEFGYRATDEAGNSSMATVTIFVAPVNDSPRFKDEGNPPPVGPDAGPQRVRNWAYDIFPGRFEDDQTVEFLVTNNSNPGLFAPGGQPAVETSTPERRESDLTYTPSGRTGTAEIMVAPRDNGGRENGGSDTGQAHVFTITIR